MAQTLIGQLILRLKAQGLGEADKVRGALTDIERTAKTLGATTPNWGLGFQKSLNQLKLTRTELERIQASWVNLHKNMGSADNKKNVVDHWKTQTLGHYAQVIAGAESAFTKIENRAKTHNETMKFLGRSLMVSMGYYTAAYGGGLAIAGSLRAASEQARTDYRLQLAGISDKDRGRMDANAEAMSVKYGALDENTVLELQKTLWGVMGGSMDNVDGVLDQTIRSFMMTLVAQGPQAAVGNFNKFIKFFDNANRNKGVDGGADSITKIMEGAIRAQQVEGAEFDVGAYLDAAMKAKMAKYGLSDDFFALDFPAIAQDFGASRTGDAMAGAFQNFVTPSNGGSQGLYIKRQKAWGLRTADNEVIEQELLGANPYRWVTEVLTPILEKQNVDMTSETAVAAAIKKVMSNRLAADLYAGLIVGKEQIDKNRDLHSKAVGTADAENARYKDPFVALQSLKSAFSNLSDAVVPIESIAFGLNKLADGINYLQSAISDSELFQDNKLLAFGGLLAGGAAGVYGGVKGASKMLDLFGLKSSALALDGSAAALTKAAYALHGSAALDGSGVPGKKNPAGRFSKLAGYAKDPRTLAVALTAGVLSYVFSQTRDGNLKPVDDYTFGARDGFRKTPQGHNGAFLNVPSAFRKSDHYTNQLPLSNSADETYFDSASVKAAADELTATLSVEATPRLNLEQLDAGIAKAQRFRNILAGAGSDIAQADADLGAELRRNFAD